MINWCGKMPGYDAKMWNDATSVATVMSFADVVDQFHVAYDNSVDDKFHVRSWKEDKDQSEIDSGVKDVKKLNRLHNQKQFKINPKVIHYATAI